MMTWPTPALVKTTYERLPGRPPHFPRRSSAIAVIVDRELSGKNEHAGQHRQADSPQSCIYVRSRHFQQAQKTDRKADEMVRCLHHGAPSCRARMPLSTAISCSINTPPGCALVEFRILRILRVEVRPDQSLRVDHATGDNAGMTDLRLSSLSFKLILLFDMIPVKSRSKEQ
jgi:hypothetical protein